MGDTPPGPPSEVAAPTGCSLRFVEGTGRVSICENTSENASRVKLVPMTSVAGGFRAASRLVNGLKDQKRTAIVPGAATSAGHSGAVVSSPAGTGRRALRARRRVQVSSSDRCVPSSRKDFESCFEARERVITCDSDLAMLPLSSSLVPCLSVSAVSVGSSRGRVFSESVSCVRCGVSLVVGSGAHCESCTHVVSVCVHDSWTDLIDHNSWKHGHEAAGGTKALNQSSGSMDGCSFVDTVVGGGTVFTRGTRRNKS